MQTALFDFDLPPNFIAQQPAEPRDSSRLLVLHRATGEIEHRRFRDVGDYLRSGDHLVANNSRVIPARLHGRKATGGAVEVFLLKPLSEDGLKWACLTKGRNLREGSEIEMGRWGDGETGWVRQSPHLPISARIVTTNNSGTRVVEFSASPLGVGEIPLPPYITEFDGDRERYQTVYSDPQGSAAAPTAGLHFTPDLLLDLRARGIPLETVTLHVGLDTFRPVSAERVEEHEIHSEYAELDADTARRLNEATLVGGQLVAVGTTSARTLEWAATAAQGVDPYDTSACPWQRVAAFAGNVDLFVRPGYRFRAVDALVTNFHLPRSSLLLMVSAFVGQPHEEVDTGREMLLAAYEVAKRENYRFYSFGDAMLIL